MRPTVSTFFVPPHSCVCVCMLFMWMDKLRVLRTLEPTYVCVQILSFVRFRFFYHLRVVVSLYFTESCFSFVWNAMNIFISALLIFYICN
jgi:hypothetical protein